MFLHVKAGAGCGKTTFIINKIKKITKEDSNRKILLITYTNSCVEEISLRLKNEYINTDNIEIGTFHSLCNNFVNSNKIFTDNNCLNIISNYLKIELPKEFFDFYNYLLNHSPIDYNNYLKELEKIFPGKKLQILPKNLNLYFTDNGSFRKIPPATINNNEDKNQWKETLSLLKDHFNNLNFEYNIYFLKLFNKIENARKKLNIYTYHHMVLDVLDSIEDFVLNIINEYDEIFIDEVQDLSHIQFKIIEYITEEIVYFINKNITIVGDINQSIYSFQGANENNFINFIEKIKNIPNINYEEIFLNETYRFGGHILKTINNKFYFHKSNILDGSIELLELAITNQKLIDVVNNKITEIIKKYSNSTIMILFQKRTSLIYSLEELLEENPLININIYRKLSTNNEVLSNFFNLINFLITKDNKKFLEFLLGGMIEIPEPQLYNFILSLNGNLEDFYIKVIDNFSYLQVIEELKKIIFFTEYNRKIKDFLNLFKDSFLAENFYNFYGKDAVILIYNLEKIIDDSMRLEDLIYMENETLCFYEKGNVIFSTIHNSKGREADYIFIVDGNDILNNNKIFLVNNYPIYYFFSVNNIDKNNKEFKNLLYVSLTRAKKKVYIIGKGKNINKGSLYEYLI
jgi:DNA helicase-2/ATP-dependent DNA helicase PcrA